ncbi:MAG: bacteriohemerythrin [Salinivirgaceae bacterium]
MAFMTWNQTLSVKIKTIDDQHIKLIEMINDFYDNVKNRSNNDNISALITGMKKYILTHFYTEEKYMVEFNYPNYEEHKKEHDLFISKLSAVEEKFNSGKVVVSFEITGFLKDWLKNHIQVTDKQYSDFFIKNGVK